MKAIRIHAHGGIDVLQIDDIPEPAPKPGEVKIQIKASALNHLDIWIRRGMPGVKLPLPLVPGSDGAGIVDAIGSGVKKFKKGDAIFLNPGFGCGECDFCKKEKINLCLNYEVLGENCNGTHQQFVCVKEIQVIPLPTGLTFEEAASFPLAFMTAWHMLVEKGQIQKGQTVLIMAGGSGVGSAGIQIAKLHGARVITTVGSDQAKKHAAELGADEVIDHYNEDIAKRVKEITGKKGVNLTLEHIGPKVWNSCMKCLAKNGRLVTCGGTTGGDVSINLPHLFIKHLQIIGSTMGTGSDLEKIAKWMGKGKLKPVIHEVLPFTEIRKAHEILEKGGIYGKVVLKW